jgi:hypothetical protein
MDVGKGGEPRLRSRQADAEPAVVFIDWQDMVAFVVPAQGRAECVAAVHAERVPAVACLQVLASKLVQEAAAPLVVRELGEILHGDGWRVHAVLDHLDCGVVLMVPSAAVATEGNEAGDAQ